MQSRATCVTVPKATVWRIKLTNAGRSDTLKGILLDPSWCRMPLLINCPSGHRLKVPLKRAGHLVRCPVCDQSVEIPPLPARKTVAALPDRPPQARNHVGRPAPAASERLDAQPGDATTPAPTMAELSRDAATILPAPPLAPLGTMTSDQPLSSTRVSTGGSTLPKPNSSARDSADVTLPVPRFDVREDAKSEPASPPPTFDLGIDTSSSSARENIRATIEQAESRRDRERKWTVYGLGIVALGLAALCATPSVMDQVASWQGRILRPADTWTYLVLLMALIQAALAVYAMRLPDWSTSWVVSLAATAAAAMYALGLALTMFADQENHLVRQLGLLDEAFRGTAQRWCFLVMCVTLILAYCYGRFSLRWYQADQRLRETRH